MEDKGIGIDQKYLKKIGAKFFRVPTGDVHNTKGFGLGLHYVTKIAKAHDWPFVIESTIGEGTKISLTLSPKVN